MATYMLLIHGDSAAWADMGAGERARIEAGHRRFVGEAGAAVVSGHELAHASTATSLRSRGADRPDVTDGPFLETKEVLGGYYVIDVDDLDAAIRPASLLPEASADYAAGVEIRPVV